MAKTAADFDLIVIGAGPGGYVAAIRAAQLGLKTAIIEKDALGGVCLNWGCIPTKALLRSAEIYDQMHHAADYGLSANPGFDLAAIVKRSRAIAGQLSGGIAHLMKKNKITVIKGTAILRKGEAAPLVVVGDTEYRSGHVILATGARLRTLPDIGLAPDGKAIWTAKEAMVPKEIPKSLLIIGSGAIGMEFASFYNSFGADVTIAEIAPRILPAEDEEISKLALSEFKKRGMTFMLGAQVKSAKTKNGGVNVEIAQNGKSAAHQFDKVILAIGIAGNVEDMGLSDLGVAMDRGHVQTGRYCETNIAGLFAIGDVAGPPWLAHKASHEGVICAEHIAGKNPHPLNPDRVPGCTYCQPQIASVGLTEVEAKDKGYNVKVGRFPFIGNGKAIALGEPSGLIKTVFDAGTGELLGAHMIGAEVTELIQGYAVAQTLETTEAELMHTIFPHPTLSEMMHESVLDAFERVIHF